MEQVVYVDLFFMINFSMDFLCFYLSSQLLSSKFSIFRVLAASALGGIYACASLFLGISGIFGIFLDIFICFLMCLLAFLRGGHIIGHTFVYIAVSAVLGGFMTVMFQWLNKAQLPLEELAGDGPSAWILLALAIICAAVTLFGGKFFRGKAERRHTKIHISIDGKSKMLEGLCDSGNMLCEPISGKPCIVADADALRELLPEELLSAAKRGETGYCIHDEELIRRLRIIPTQTATGRGLLTAVRCDSISVCEGDKSHEVQALLAISSIGGTADGAEALVPASLMML